MHYVHLKTSGVTIFPVKETFFERIVSIFFLLFGETVMTLKLLHTSFYNIISIIISVNQRKSHVYYVLQIKDQARPCINPVGKDQSSFLKEKYLKKNRDPSSYMFLFFILFY